MSHPAPLPRDGRLPEIPSSSRGGGNAQPSNNSMPRSSGKVNGAGLPAAAVAAAAGPPNILPSLEPNQARGIIRDRPGPQSILPSEKVFPIQIGSELFRLSGASITSDAPSYFTRFFEEQLRENDGDGGVRTLYIDRDPVIFRDIALHLQGYYIQPQNGSHYVRLFADAQFYSLPRLISQLFESETFIRIGDRHFQVPKDIFSSPGDSPNFFTLGFGAFFASPDEIFPGLDKTGLLRPPSIIPPAVPSRSADIFAQLLHLLRGYPLHVRDEDHRAELLRDCRYFHLRGLEQRLIPHETAVHPRSGQAEITLRFEDVKGAGISFVVASPSPADASSAASKSGTVHYARPFVDDTPRDLIVEIGAECTILDHGTSQARFTGPGKARIVRLLRAITDIVNGATNVCRDEQFRFQIHPSEAHVALDGKAADMVAVQRMITKVATEGPGPSQESASKKRKLDADADASANASASAGTEPESLTWTVRTGQWRVQAQQQQQQRDATKEVSLEIVLVAVKVDAYTNERARNAGKRFLG